MIPKVVHRIWFGPKKIPDVCLEYGRKWESLGYETRLWTEANLPPLVNQRIYDEIGERGTNAGSGIAEIGVWVQRADVVAYELIQQMGGIYANMDMEPVRVLDDILDGVTAFAGIEEHPWICNALMGCTPGHWFFAKVISELPARYDRDPGGVMSHVTGPHLLTDVAHRFGGLTVFGAEKFYPFIWHQMERENEEHPDAYTIHHWHHRKPWLVEDA